MSTMNNNFYIKQVQLIDSISSEISTSGTVHVLGTHFIFKADEGGKEIWVSHTLIVLLDRGQPTLTGSRLTIRCKHFLVLIFLISKEKDCQSLYDTLLRCSRLSKNDNISECLAFANKKANCSPQTWHRLNWSEEMRRQGVEDTDSWAVSDFNANFVHCDTYPEQLWFPKEATTQILIASCRFRSRARLPVLTYFHKNNGAALCRSSQPLAGFSARCLEDENLMEFIMAANPSSTHLYLVDTRPRVNAMVNKVQGKGFEDTRNYTNMQSHFFDIENIHVMRASLNKLLEACQRTQTMTQYLKTVDNSGWLRHLKTLLDCSVFIAQSILRGISCVVHCSDGWDRTSQTVSLAQIIIDPFYRTLKGFQVLIDKDWLGFGFKFDDRCGHLGASIEEMAREVSPIFTQFLDSVYQLLRKKPMCFELNERFLVELNEYAYSCVHGQFVGNCDKDRKDLRVSTRTNSLWAYMDLHIEDYQNPFYEPNSDSLLSDIDLNLSSIAVWTNLYNRFDIGIQSREYLNDIVMNTKLHVQSMKTASDLENSRAAFAWQSLLSADECANEKCRREFLSRIERRVHCDSCGQIYCHRILEGFSERIGYFSKEEKTAIVAEFMCSVIRGEKAIEYNQKSRHSVDSGQLRSRKSVTEGCSSGWVKHKPSHHRSVDDRPPPPSPAMSHSNEHECTNSSSSSAYDTGYKRSLCVYILRLSCALTEHRVRWEQLDIEGDAPDDKLLYSFVVCCGENVLFGGMQSDESDVGLERRAMSSDTSILRPRYNEMF